MALTITIPGAVETTTGSTAPAVLTVGVGSPGQGVPSGGSTGQVLQKLSATKYDTGWTTPSADFITSVTSPLAVGSGVLSVDLSAKANLASPSLTGTPLSTTAAVDTNTTQIATTAFVVGQAGTGTPIVDGSAAVGTSLLYSRQDHVHPTDTTRAALASPTFTGAPSLPTGSIGVTQTAGNNTTAVATTAFVTTADNLKANIASPSLTGTPLSVTSSLSNRSTQIATMEAVKNMIWHPGSKPFYSIYEMQSIVSGTGATVTAFPPYSWRLRGASNVAGSALVRTNNSSVNSCLLYTSDAADE